MTAAASPSTARSLGRAVDIIYSRRRQRHASRRPGTHPHLRSPSWTTVADGVTKTIPFDSNLNIYDEYQGYNGEQIKQADTVMLTYPLNFSMASGVGLNDLN